MRIRATSDRALAEVAVGLMAKSGSAQITDRRSCEAYVMEAIRQGRKTPASRESGEKA